MWDTIEMWDINVLTTIEISNNNYISNIIKQQLLIVIFPLFNGFYLILYFNRNRKFLKCLSLSYLLKSLIYWSESYFRLFLKK